MSGGGLGWKRRVALSFAWANAAGHWLVCGGFLVAGDRGWAVCWAVLAALWTANAFRAYGELRDEARVSAFFDDWRAAQVSNLDALAARIRARAAIAKAEGGEGDKSNE